MDAYINDYIDQLQTSVSIQYESRETTPSGRMALKNVNPVNAINNTVTFTTDEEELLLTTPLSQVEITPAIDSALWKALDSSTPLISNGRLST
jgi:hypothetical protein